jgi:hypothetical protein
MSGERRQATRQKSLLRGLVYFGNSPSAVNCVVRDFSDTGARLKFDGPITAPDQIELRIPVKNQALPCRVQWREPDEIGVSFVTEVAAAQPANEEELSQRVERLEAEIATLKQMIRRLQRTSGPISGAA